MNFRIYSPFSLTTNGLREKVFTALSLCLAICMATTAQSQDAKLHFAASTYPPITTSDKDGMLDQIALEAFKRADIPFDYETTSAQRGLFGAVSGEFDGYLGAPPLKSASLQSLVRVPEVAFPAHFAGIHLNDGIELNDLADFNDYNVGYISGWRRVEFLLAEHPNISTATTADLLLDMLANGRIDVAFIHISQAKYLAKQKGISGLKFSKYTLNNDLYIHLNPEHADISVPLAAALRSMKDDGTFAGIMADIDRVGGTE